MYQDIIKDMRAKMGKIAERFKGEVTLLRTGRATPSLVEHIKVECYGEIFLLSHIASVSVALPQTLVIQPWDKNNVEPIQKALSQSQLGVQPVVDKDVVRLILPSLTEERRKNLIRLLDQKTEEARVAIRHEREEAVKKIQKMKEEKQIREDDFFRAKNEIQKIVDEFNNEKIKSLRDKKEQEILST